MSNTTALEHARALHAKGFAVIPVEYKSKAPNAKRWQDLRLAFDDLPQQFSGQANIGILWGEPSGGVIDVDLDTDEAVALADRFLPPTKAVFGRDSRPRSHRLYRATGDLKTRKWSGADGGTAFELRATGTQTIAPGSIHPSGESVRWDESGKPAEVDPETLLGGLAKLHDALGASEVATKAAAHLGRIPPAKSGEQGHNATYKAATDLVHGFELDPDVALVLLERDFNPRCEPRWSEKELRHKVEDAASKPHDAPRGWLLGDSFSPHPLDCELKRNEFTILRLGDLGEPEPISWIWEPFLATGYVSLLVAQWKTGKTTLIAHLIRDLERGAGLVSDRMDGRVLVLSEENPDLWRVRSGTMDLPEDTLIAPSPWMGRPTRSDWEEALHALPDTCAKLDIKLVVIDTISAFWCVDEENSATDVVAAMAAIKRLAHSGVAVLVVHHPRKGEVSAGQMSRGSGALPAAVDIIVEMVKPEGESGDTKRRVLKAVGRLASAQSQHIIELRGDGYAMLGSAKAAKLGDIAEAVEGVLREAKRPLTFDTLNQYWPDGAVKKPGENRIRQALQHLVDQGRAVRTGTGKRGDPQKWSLPDSIRLAHTPKTSFQFPLNGALARSLFWWHGAGGQGGPQHGTPARHRRTLATRCAAHPGQTTRSAGRPPAC